MARKQDTPLHNLKRIPILLMVLHYVVPFVQFFFKQIAMTHYVIFSTLRGLTTCTHSFWVLLANACSKYHTLAENFSSKTLSCYVEPSQWYALFTLFICVKVKT